MNTKTLIASVLIAVGCFSVTAFAEKSEAKSESIESVISAAKDAQKKAASVGGEWRDVGKFIKKAEAAAKDGKAKKAMKLAKKALQQSEDGYKQAMEQAESVKGFPDYMK